MSTADVILSAVWTLAWGLTALTWRRSRKLLREAGEIHRTAMAEFARWQTARIEAEREREQ